MSDPTYLYLHNVPKTDIKSVLETIPQDTEFIHIIGFHITTQAKYPFIQYLVEKNLDITHDKEICKFSKIEWENDFEKMETKINELISNVVNSFFNDEKVKENFTFRLLKIVDKYYLVIDFSSLNMEYLQLDLNSKYWFVLITEVINHKRVCNNYISREIFGILMNYPDLMTLYKNVNAIHPIASVGFSSSDHKLSKFQSIFGLLSDELLNKKYFALYSDFNEAAKQITNKYPVDEKNIEVGINRYVYFEEMCHIVDQLQHVIPDIKLISGKFETTPTETIYIGYKNKEEGKVVPNIILKNYEQHYHLTSHLRHMNNGN